MPDYIDCDAVYHAISVDGGLNAYEKAYCIDVVRKIPAEDVAPVRHGRWVEYENESDMGYHYCSECKHQAFNYDEGGCNVEILSDYCPHCGARMDGGDEDGNEAYRG